MATFAETLRALRGTRTRRELAATVGISMSAMKKFEGGFLLPSRRRVWQLAHALGVAPHALLAVWQPEWEATREARRQLWAAMTASHPSATPAAERARRSRETRRREMGEARWRAQERNRLRAYRERRQQGRA